MEFSDELLERIKVRLKAARALAGYKNPGELAQHPACKREKLTAAKIRGAEAKERDTTYGERVALAEACDLPAAWFEVPDLAEAVRLGAMRLDEKDGDGKRDTADAPETAGDEQSRTSKVGRALRHLPRPSSGNERQKG